MVKPLLLLFHFSIKDEKYQLSSNFPEKSVMHGTVKRGFKRLKKYKSLSKPYKTFPKAGVLFLLIPFPSDVVYMN